MYPLPPAVKYLLMINIAVFGIQHLLPFDLKSLLGLYYFGIPDFRIYQLITHFFTHANLPHIAFNMISLYSIGMMLERVWGSKRFMNYYMICGLGAGFFHLLVQSIEVYSSLGHLIISESESALVYPSIGGIAVGASGAIFGLFTAVAVLFPNTEFMLFFIPIPIKAKYLFVALILIDLLMGIANPMGDPIARWAHLGGVVTGWILLRIYQLDKTRFY